MTSSNSQMHNDIMAAGSKERPPMVVPGSYAQWKSRFMRYVDTKTNRHLLKQCIEKGPHVFSQVKKPVESENTKQEEEFIVETYQNTTDAVRKLINAEAEAVHMILNGIGDDIYSTVDACPNAKEMWIAIECLQQGESINKQDVKAKVFWEFGKFTSMEEESIESYYTRFYKMMNKMIVKPTLPPTELASEEDNDEEQAQRDKQIYKSLALIAKHFNNIYKPTNNNLKTSSNTRNKNVGTTPRTENDKHTGQFENQRTVTVAGNRETIGNQVVQQSGIQCYNFKGFGNFAKNAEHSEWLQDTHEELDKQELEAYYMYMTKSQEVLHATNDTSRPTYDAEPLEKAHPDDDYNVFAIEKQYFEQPESINDIYLMEKVNSNVTPDSSKMSTNELGVEQNNEEPEDERVLLASLISNLKLDVD
ncbi:hypothetical protein Tco_1451840 [Tanacetum coccineum]